MLSSLAAAAFFILSTCRAKTIYFRWSASEYQTDEQYEHDSLTDDNANSEYFEDDENEAYGFNLCV